MILALGNPTNGSVAGLVCYDFAVNYAEPGLAVSQTAFEVKTNLCGAVAGVLSIQFRAIEGQLLASERLMDHTLEAPVGTVVSTGDSLLLVSEGPLNGDELVSAVTSVLGSAQSAMSITAWAGESLGCGFT